MGCCVKFCKYIIFLLNILFSLAGIALIVMGAYIHISMTRYLDFLNSPYLNLSIVMILIGLVVFIISFFGCYGARTENYCMMLTYATLLVMITLSLIALALIIYFFKDNAKKVIEQNMKKAMRNYNSTDFDGVTDIWDTVQGSFHCCGVVNYTDWAEGLPGNTNGDVPDKCCKDPQVGCGKGLATITEKEAKVTIYTIGCFAKLEQLVVGEANMAIYIGVGIIIILFMGAFIACCVGRNMKKHSQDKYHATSQLSD